MIPRLEAFLTGATPEEINRAFWAPATAASNNARSFCSTAAPTSTGYRTGRTARRWTRQPAPPRPISSPGCAVSAATAANLAKVHCRRWAAQWRA